MLFIPECCSHVLLCLSMVLSKLTSSISFRKGTYHWKLKPIDTAVSGKNISHVLAGRAEKKI